MSYLMSYASILLALLAPTVIRSQGIDTDFCNIDKIPIGPDKLDPPRYQTNLQYQARIEKNSKNLRETETITEYFDGVENVAVSITRFLGTSIRTYNFYNTDELFLVKDDQCVKFNISTSFELSPFLVIQDNTGKEKIASLITLLLSGPEIDLKYLGSSVFVRGIPVNVWQTCLYSQKEQKTIRLTLSLSNPLKWSGAYVSQNITSIPVQIQMETKTSSGIEDTVTYTFTRFRPYLDDDEYEHLTPRGIYCPERINTRIIPDLPSAFTFHSQIIETLSNLPSNTGDVRYAREEYDYNSKLFRYSFKKDGGTFTDVHDFNTGIKYTFNDYTGNCTTDFITIDNLISEMDDDPNYIRMKNVTSFFELTDSNYQYIGARLLDGIYTNTWTGQKLINNLDHTIEWHLLGRNWKNSDLVDRGVQSPILIFYSHNSKLGNETIKRTKYRHIFDFRTKHLKFTDYDLSFCRIQNTKKSFYVRFNVTTRQVYEIKVNLNNFLQSFSVQLQKIAQVTPLRIHDVNVRFSDAEDYIDVFFNLFEKVNEYGSVKPPENDKSLIEASLNIESFFNNPENELQIIFREDYNEEIVRITAKGGTLFTSRGIVELAGYTTGSIASVTIIVTINGLLIGVLIIAIYKFRPSFRK